MQIHDLNTKALTNPAYVAFDDGTDTYKADFKAEIDNAAASAVADADLTDNTVAFTSGDAASPTEWTAVDVLTSGLPIKTLFSRISTIVKNVRWLYSKLGTTDISSIGGGTVTGAISSLNSNSPQAGYGAIAVATTAETSIQITFPRPFSTAPRVVVSLYNSSYNRRLHIKNITSTGFTVVGALLTGSSSAAIEFEWIAVMP